MEGGRKRTIDNRDKGKAIMREEEKEEEEVSPEKKLSRAEEIAAEATCLPEDFLSRVEIDSFTLWIHIVKKLRIESNKLADKANSAAEHGHSTPEQMAEMFRVSTILANFSQELALRLRVTKTLVDHGLKEEVLCKMQWATKSEAASATLNISHLLVSISAMEVWAQNMEVITKNVIDPQLVEEVPNTELKQNLTAQAHSSSNKELEQLRATPVYLNYKQDLAFAAGENFNICNDLQLSFREKLRAKEAVMLRTIDEYFKVVSVGIPFKVVMIPAKPECAALINHAHRFSHTIILYRSNN